MSHLNPGSGVVPNSGSLPILPISDSPVFCVPFGPFGRPAVQPTTASLTNTSLGTSTTPGSGDIFKELDWSGRIVPDKEYRHKLIQRAHQRHVRECLAQAIFHKVLDMERVHQIEIKRKLEEFARREKVHKTKVERSKRYEEEVIHILSPRPPTRLRASHTQNSGPDHSESSESPGSSRPNTAPGKMQRPVRLKPIHSNSTTASHRRSSPYHQDSSNDTDQRFNFIMDKDSKKHLATTEFSRGISPYRLPVINNFVTPVPPSIKRKDRGLKGTPSGTLRGRRLRPTTAPCGPEESPMLRIPSVQSKVCVTMMFFGKTVHLSHDFIDMRDEVKVFQQHCGGENLCVYKGKLSEGETFQFVSRRHRGFPFSLTFFLNGLQVERLSSCCEFKHRKGSRLGGRHGHFGFSHVEGASPCYKCIIAMGLDKKPTPPPKRVKPDVGRDIGAHQDTTNEAPEVEEEPDGGHPVSEPASSQPQDMETEIKEEITHEDKIKDDYEEDFEADEEGPVEDGEEKKDRKSSSLSLQKEEEEPEKHFQSDSEVDEKEEKGSRSSSSSSTDSEESEVEAEAEEDQPAVQTKDPVDGKPAQVDPDGSTTDIPAEKDEKSTEATTTNEEASPTPPQTSSSPTGEDTGTQDSPAQSPGPRTEPELSDDTVLSEVVCNGDEDTVGSVRESDVEKPADELTKDEPDRAKSVQEKLAEAILKEAQCSSEPELSDTSTEEEEESADKTTQLLGSPGGAAVTFTMKRQIPQFEVKCEDTAEQTAQEVASQSVLEEGDIPAEQKTEHDEAATASEKKTEEAGEEQEILEMNPVVDDTEMEESKEIILGEEMEVQTDEPAKASDVEEPTVKDEKEDEQEMTEENDVHEPEQNTVRLKTGENDEFVPPERETETGVETVETADAETEVRSEVETTAMPLVEPRATVLEQASVTDAEKQGDKQDMLGGTEIETIAENSSSSSEGSRDTTVHAEQTADTDEKSKNTLEETKDELKGGIEQVIKEEEKGTESTGEEKTVELDTSDKLDEPDKTENEDLIDEEGIAVSEEANKGTDDVAVGDKDTEKGDVQDNEDKEGEAEMVRDDKVEDENPSSEGKLEEKVQDAEIVEDQDNPKGKGSEVEYPNEALEGADNVGDTEKVAEPGTDDKTEGQDVEEGQVQEDKEVGDDRSCDGEEPDKDTATKAEEILSDDKRTDNYDRASSSGNETEITKVKEAYTMEEKVEKTDGSKKIQAEEGETREDDQKSEISNKVLDLENIENRKPDEDKNDTEDNGAEVKEESKDNQDDKNDCDVQSEQAEPASICEPQSEPQKEGTESTIHDGADEHETEAQESDEPEVTSGELNKENDEENAGEVQSETNCEEIQVAQAAHTLDFGEPLNVEDEPSPESTAEKSDLRETEAVKEEKESEKLLDEPEQEMDCDKSNGETALENEAEDQRIQDENDNTNIRELLVESSVLQSQTLQTPELVSDSVPEARAEHDPPCDTGSNADEPNKRDESIEEASKPSEEGASIVHKPQAETEQQRQEEATDLNKESRASHGEANVLEDVETQEQALTPEILDKEDHRDLVSNWVNMHQASKYFETFVEPLDELKRVKSDDAVSQSNSNATMFESTVLSETPDRLRAIAQNIEDDVHYEKADTDHKEEQQKASDTNIEVVDKHSDIRSNNSKQDEPDQTGPTEELKSDIEVTDLPHTSDAENKSREETATPAKDSPKEDDEKENVQTEITDVSKDQVESLAGTNLSDNNVKDNMAENQDELGEGKEQCETQPATSEEVIDLPALNKTEEEQQESRESPECSSKSEPKEILKASVDTKEAEEQEVTEVTDLTVISGSKNGSQQDLQSVRHPDENGKVDNKDLELIGDPKETLDKDEVTTFSVDGSSLFARTSYPLLTTARAESGY